MRRHVGPWMSPHIQYLLRVRVLRQQLTLHVDHDLGGCRNGDVIVVGQTCQGGGNVISSQVGDG